MSLKLFKIILLLIIMIKNATDLYNSNKQWYDWLPERKYMIMNFLPNCEGRTLNVGVHEFNKNDELACKHPDLYETIDIDDRCKNFGSKHKHYTVDFLDHNPGYKYDNILLFGVLGIWDGCGGYNYTLEKKEHILMENIDRLLNVKGRVLLGPDVNPQSGAGENSYSTQNFWTNYIKTNTIIKEKYKIKEFFKGRSNLIIVLEKQN
tara:strand:- start:11807 stop:12424 length:618 start_codon:yes stop_codon:yes gene_type:complete